MVTLDDLLDAGDERRERTSEAGQRIAGYLRIGLWSIGWALAKLVLAVCGVIAGVFFAIGWACARTMPVLKWIRVAFVLGWEAGRARGPA